MYKVLFGILVASLVAATVSFTVTKLTDRYEHEFCKQADSYSYCMNHPDKGDDIRLGA
jgi:hypothetical protein